MELVIQDTRKYFDKSEARENLASRTELTTQDTRKYPGKPKPRENLAFGTCLTPQEISQLNCLTDEKVIRLYLLQASPLHVRRTLDQSFYYTLADTSQRDSDQVVYRYMKDHMSDISKPSVLMVDQCWLWILDGSWCSPFWPLKLFILTHICLDTVITCFPSRWNVQKFNKEATDDSTDVLQTMVDLLRGDQGQKIRTAWSLAEFIVDYCSRSVFNHEIMPNEEYQFLEFFSRSISKVVSIDIQYLHLVLETWLKLFLDG